MFVGGCTSRLCIYYRKKKTNRKIFSFHHITENLRANIVGKCCAGPGHIPRWENVPHTRTGPALRGHLTCVTSSDCHCHALPRQKVQETTASSISLLETNKCHLSKDLSWVGIQIEALPVNGS